MEIVELSDGRRSRFREQQRACGQQADRRRQGPDDEPPFAGENRSKKRGYPDTVVEVSTALQGGGSTNETPLEAAASSSATRRPTVRIACCSSCNQLALAVRALERSAWRCCSTLVRVLAMVD